MCDILEVTRGGYYARRDRPANRREIRRVQLLERIGQVHAASRGLYGSPRVTAELKETGVEVCENTVARLMREMDLRSKIVRRFRPKTTDSNHPCPVAPNRLDRVFSARKPNRKWCCDITYIPTNQGTLYLAGAIDLYSRRIVGWSMADHMKASLCMNALEMAVLHRRPDEGLLHHSDRGVQYACDDYQELLEKHGIECSMSGVGDCYDNAVMESFWGTLKQELLYQQPNGRFESHEQARRMIFEYIEVFYNRQRRHSAIGYVSPEMFEAGLN
jgi:transposase InsO family protein